jgi:APA family basic amino acid/polyamine antiporter
MAVIGSIVGLFNGTLGENFTTTVPEAVLEAAGVSGSGGLFAAVVATVFAYEGWIVATSINAELKNPKRNLPLALLVGSLVVIAAYVLYYIGVAGGASNEVLIKDGATVAFRNIFGAVGGSLLSICIVISCLGTLNGLMVATTRGMYAIAVRGKGPRPSLFSQIDPETNTATNSAVWGLLVSGIWMLYFYGANLAPDGGWFGIFNFDSSELPIVTLYAFYIPMFVLWMKKERGLGAFRRFVLPSLSIIACGFMIFAAVYAHGITPYLAAAREGRFSFPVLFYLIVFAAVMLLGYLATLRRREK